MEICFFNPPNLIIGKISFEVKTRAYLNKEKGMMALLSTIEPENIDETLSEGSWVIAMEEELCQGLECCSPF